MKTEKFVCDKCKKEIKNAQYLSHVDISLRYWHGGSMGGEEDIDRYTFDLCGDCAEQLSSNIKKWLKI